MKFKLVPVKATNEMVENAQKVYSEAFRYTGYGPSMEKLWSASIKKVPSPWQPIETAPKDRAFIGYGAGGPIICWWSAKYDWWADDNGVLNAATPTHWMPFDYLGTPK